MELIADPASVIFQKLLWRVVRYQLLTGRDCCVDPFDSEDPLYTRTSRATTRRLLQQQLSLRQRLSHDVEASDGSLHCGLHDNSLTVVESQ